MGKADEERLAIGVQKYPCLYDKAVSAFHNNNQKKNAWEAVAKDIGLETGEAAKNAFTSLRTKYVRRKKTLKDLKRSGTDAGKVMKTEKDMREYLFLSWLDSFVYERNNKCNLQNNENDMEASEPVERNITEIDPIIFDDVDVQNRSSSPATFGPESGNVIAEKPSSFISQATGQLKWVKNNKASNKRQKITEAPSSNTEILRKLTETVMKEEKEDSEEDVFAKYVASELKGLNMRQKRLAKNEITNILNRLALEQLDNKMTLLDKFQYNVISNDFPMFYVHYI